MPAEIKETFVIIWQTINDWFSMKIHLGSFTFTWWNVFWAGGIFSWLGYIVRNMIDWGDR